MLTKTKKTTKLILATVFTFGLLSGCASSPLTPEELNSYDGWWTAKIQKTPKTQHANGWEQHCSNLEGEFSFEVRDGVILMNILGTSQEQILSSKGSFTIEQVTDFHVDEASGSDVQIENGQVTYIIKGKLDGPKPRGTIVDWVQEIGAGCITKIKYVRESE